VSGWWQGSVGYQVYLRSFADSDGDGIGDLPGLRARLPYLAALGVDMLWINPFFPSPQADHGYDVSDYVGVDPTFGTLDDLQAVVDEAHALGLRVLIDLVPNHTSDQHPWFQDALTGRDADHRSWYVWRDGRDGGPPNNWVSHFGGPAWTQDAASGQWWMHLFLPEQPDLNWADEDVRREFDRILGFWLERGVDGFRIDVAHSLVEHPDLLDNPLLGDAPAADAGPREVFAAFDHRHDLDQPEVLDVYRRWNRVVAPHDAALLGEVYLLDTEQVARYVADGDGLHLAFYFPTLYLDWDADAIRTTLRDAVAAGGDRFAWPLSSHDDPRAATRFGGGEVGARRALAFFALLCGLPGVPFLYQGDELGLDDGEVEAVEDPIAARNPGATGRDGSRTPMPWEPGPGFGFTTGTPWIDFGRNRSEVSTEAHQRGAATSPLERTRALLHARRGLDDLRAGPAPTWLTGDGSLVAFRRGRTVVAMHAGDGVATLPVAGTLAYATDDAVSLEDGVLTLPADSAAYVVEA
jgi:alpha-glucosidase